MFQTRKAPRKNNEEDCDIRFKIHTLSVRELPNLSRKYPSKYRKFVLKQEDVKRFRSSLKLITAIKYWLWVRQGEVHPMSSGYRLETQKSHSLDKYSPFQGGPILRTGPPTPVQEEWLKWSHWEMVSLMQEKWAAEVVKSQFTGRSTLDPQVTAQERPAIPSDGIRAQIITTPLVLLIKTWKQGVQRGGLYYSVTMYSILCKSHGLGPTSAMTIILRKENSVSVLV